MLPELILQAKKSGYDSDHSGCYRTRNIPLLKPLPLPYPNTQHYKTAYFLKRSSAALCALFPTQALQVC